MEPQEGQEGEAPEIFPPDVGDPVAIEIDALSALWYVTWYLGEMGLGPVEPSFCSVLIPTSGVRRQNQQHYQS